MKLILLSKTPRKVLPKKMRNVLLLDKSTWNDYGYLTSVLVECFDENGKSMS